MLHTLEPDFNEKFISAYEELYNLHPDNKEEQKYLYLNRQWFFNNHINIVLQNIIRFSKKYYPSSLLSVSLYGGLFHDAGLVYKREQSSPAGHENRSVEYAEQILKKLGYDTKFIDQVSECILATEIDYIPKNNEAFIVRNADAYSHMISLHFFAKANFTTHIADFIDWFEKKISITYKKLSIVELKNELLPTYLLYENAIKVYRNNNSDTGVSMVKNILENS